MAKVKVKDTAVGRKVKLTLSPEEAATLHRILRNVGGSPDHTPRRYSDAILEVLEPTIPPILPEGEGYSGSFMFERGTI